jgi:hypothetical protein
VSAILLYCLKINYLANDAAREINGDGPWIAGRGMRGEGDGAPYYSIVESMINVEHRASHTNCERVTPRKSQLRD